MSIRRTLRFVTLALLAVASACAAHARSAPPQQRRIVSLMPSLTDDLFQIGAGDRVVAVSRFTNLPQARNLPRVADFSSIDTEKIVALHPDLVVGIPSQARLTQPLHRLGIPVVLMADDGYDDVFSDILRLGDLSGRPSQARALVARLERRTAALHAQTRKFRFHPRVFVVLGTGPTWTAGPSSYVGRLIELAGGRDAATIAQPWGTYSDERLVADQPDVLIVDPAVHLQDLRDREPWRSLHAVRAGAVYAVDQHLATALFQPGPRYTEGLHWLIERLKPLSTQSRSARSS